QTRIKLGMAWPEEGTMDTPQYLKWQLNAEASVKSRKADSEVQWIMLFITRTAIMGFVLVNVFNFMRRKIPRLFRYGPLQNRDPAMRKLWRVCCAQVKLIAYRSCNIFGWYFNLAPWTTDKHAVLV
ncbi:FTSH extracellular protease family protein, partial [Trifolium medium]|nr:FTSH extracellular protease family protein [Trifolium medium]